MCFVDSLIGASRGASIGIGDGNLTESLAADDMRTLLGWNVGIRDGVICVGVAQGPAIDSDCENVVGGVKACRAEHTVQLLANLKFEIAERHGQEFLLTGAILFLAGQSGLVRISNHVEENRIIGSCNTRIATESGSGI